MALHSAKVISPIIGSVLLATVVMVPSASAAPMSNIQYGAHAQSSDIVKVYHRGGPRRGWHGGRHHELGPKAIRRSLRHQGFHRIRILDRRGPMYIVKARGWQGRPMRLVVDSRNGMIVRSRPIGHHFHWSHSW